MQRIEIIGGGPAGLHLGTLLREALPEAEVRVRERNADGATFGFGVVFSDRALDFLRADDPATHAAVTPHMERWRDMVLDLPAGRVTLDGIGFAAIGRLHLIALLQARARAAGVEVVHDAEVGDLRDLDADLLVGADGLNSVVRGDGTAFGAEIGHFSNRFAWFGTPRPFDALTQTFRRTPGGGAVNAHHYRYEPGRSTFIVECDEATFAAEGFDAMDEDASARACEALFADALDGAPLLTNRSHWRRFPRLACARWTTPAEGGLPPRALVGDAAHTAHFSVGSGTRLALEDAIALRRALAEAPTVDAGLAGYDAARPVVARKIVDAANMSAEWYDGFATRMDRAPLDFAMDYLTRSGRVDLGRLRALSPGFMARWDAREGAAA